MPFRIMISWLEQRNRTFKSIIEKKVPCIIPYCHGQHWRAILIDSQGREVYYFDSLGAEIDDVTRDATLKCFPGWNFQDKAQRF